MSRIRKRGEPLAGKPDIIDPATGEQRPKSVTELGPPLKEVKGLKSASEYTQRTKQRQEQLRAAKGRTVQVGGAPPIPAGKLQPIADAARMSQGLPQPAHVAELPKATEDPETFAAPAHPPGSPDPPPSPNGVGALSPEAIVASQADRPLTLGQAKEIAKGRAPGPQGVLSPETQQLIEHQHKMATTGEPPPEKGSSAEPLPSKKKELEDVEDALIGLEQDADPILFDFDGVRRSEIENDLWNERRRKAIESHLLPLNFSDMITKRHIEQLVIVIPDQFTCTFRTISGYENQFCQQYVFDHSEGTSTAYVQDLLGMSRLACSLISINGGHLPDHRTEIGGPTESVDRDLFEVKVGIVMRYPMLLIADLGVQQTWFTQRCAKLFTVGQLKNG